MITEHAETKRKQEEETQSNLTVDTQKQTQQMTTLDFGLCNCNVRSSSSILKCGEQQVKTASHTQHRVSEVGGQANGVTEEHDAVTGVHMMTGLQQLWYTPQTA